jgi:hypothetical protein
MFHRLRGRVSLLLRCLFWGVGRLLCVIFMGGLNGVGCTGLIGFCGIRMMGRVLVLC